MGHKVAVIMLSHPVALSEVVVMQKQVLSALSRNALEVTCLPSSRGSARSRSPALPVAAPRFAWTSLIIYYMS